MSVKISRILHAGYLFECEETTLVFDPIFENPFSVNCFAYPNVAFEVGQIRRLKFDAVFISHFHDDHCSLESLALIDRATPIYLFCEFAELFRLIQELGFLTVYPLRIDEAVSVGRFKIFPHQALDADVDLIFHVQADGANILNVVDAWIDDNTMAKLCQTAWDIVLWPFQTMREIEVLAPMRTAPAPTGLPHEWLEQLKTLNPKYLVPSSCQFIPESWSWYRWAYFPISYRHFADEMNTILPGTKLIRLNPSESVVLEKGQLARGVPLAWVTPLGDQNVDYHYDAALAPPPTSEVAKNFTSLSENETEFVYSYCRNGLIKKFKSLPSSSEPYFFKQIYWRLSIFDHEGLPVHFTYVLDGVDIQLLSDSSAPPSWLTELSIAKFYAALTNGESLTSLYMRINDMPFFPEIESALCNVDVMEDPLIRCLFTVPFGAYQRAQLNRISRGKT